MARYMSDVHCVKGILPIRLPERRQLRSQIRLGGQMTRYSEIGAETTHAHSNGYIYVTLVTDYSITAFRGSVRISNQLNRK